MKVHLKNYPCNKGKVPNGERYTAHRNEVTCAECLNPVKKAKAKGKAKPAPSENDLNPETHD